METLSDHFHKVVGIIPVIKIESIVKNKKGDSCV